MPLLEWMPLAEVHPLSVAVCNVSWWDTNKSFQALFKFLSRCFLIGESQSNLVSSYTCGQTPGE